MSSIEIVAYSVVAIWLAATTLIMVLVMRQMSLMTIRLDSASPHMDPNDHGPRVGTILPEDTLVGPEFQSDKYVLALLSTSCSPCREFAESLTPEHVEGGVIIGIAGEDVFAGDVAELLPSTANVAKGESTTQAAVDLGIELMPFALRIESRRIVAKMFLKTPEDLQQLVYFGGRPDGLTDDDLALVSVPAKESEL